jgi:hypothetical protein
VDRNVLIVTACLETLLMAVKFILHRFKSGARVKWDGRVSTRWEVFPYKPKQLGLDLSVKEGPSKKRKLFRLKGRK